MSKLALLFISCAGITLACTAPAGADGFSKRQCTVAVVNGKALTPVKEHPGYFISRPYCPNGTRTTGGGFRREFADEAAIRDWRNEGSYPVDTNKVIESWACMVKYIGAQQPVPNPPSELWCYAVCCP